ncbi:hypothetical protein B0H13DRAFT_2494886 [Mycena leptocephala]|nr:hypothetical protein B0H13DRAFT_2494886 [Mycena leptocephala]
MFRSPNSNSSSAHTSPASLVDPNTSTDTLTQLINIKVNTNVIATPTLAPVHRGDPRPLDLPRPLVKFTSFVSSVLASAQTRPATLLVALVYISRVRPHLCVDHAGLVLERVFLGALICADKYTNDSALKNAQWLLCIPGHVFGKRGIARIEREFLAVLDWELGARDYTDTPPPAPRTPLWPRQRPQTRAFVPQSSPGSQSPRTPHSPVLSPYPLDVPMDVHEGDMPVPIILARKGGEFDDILRAFSSPRTRSHPEWF